MNDALPQVSIIVPVYNTPEKYLSVALDGIRQQTYGNIQVIVVDDGSNKPTAAYLDKYVELLENWQVIHQNNKGLSGARNSGYKLATGKYIQFLDGDDIFEKNLIEMSVMQAEKTGAEIVIENFIARDCETNKETIVLSPHSLPQTDVFRLLDIPGSKFQTIPYNVWSKLFKKNFLDDSHLLHDEELHRSEDVLFTDSALILAERITVVMEPFITYRENLPSSNTKTNDKHPDVSVLAWKKMYHFLVSRGQYEDLRDDFEVAMTASLFWHFERLHHDSSKQKLAEASTELFNQIKIRAKNNPRCVLELTVAAPELVPFFVEKLEEAERLMDQVRTLEAQLSLVHSELQALRYPGIKLAARRLAGAVKRRMKLHLRDS